MPEDSSSRVAKGSQYVEYGFTLGRLGSGARRLPQIRVAPFALWRRTVDCNIGPSVKLKNTELKI